MGLVHELRIRSNRFVERIDSYVAEVIDDNEKLLNLNRQQLKEEHKTSKDQPIRPVYARWYAELKGFDTPDLYATGETQKTLTIEATKSGQFHIDGHTEQVPKLLSKYGEDIFGIPRSRTSEAKEITTQALAELFKEIVLIR